MSRKKNSLVMALALLILGGTTVLALINPEFTLKDLTDQSDVVLLLEFKNVNEEGTAVAAVKEVIKGNYEKREVTIEMLAMPEAFHAQGKEAMKLIDSGQKQALLFVGLFNAEGDGGGGGDEAKGFLHLSGRWNAQTQWYVLERWKDVWDVTRHSSYLLGTFAGSTDMASRAVRQFLSNEDSEMPVACGVEWDDEVKVGKFEEQFRDARAIDIDGTNESGRADLFLASDSGDRIFRFNGRTLEDVTSKLNLTTRSRASAWADFNSDGRLDLASWDGNRLTLSRQQDDSTFEPQVCDTDDALADGCLSLTTLGVGSQGIPALLAGTRTGPVLLVAAPDGGLHKQPVLSGESARTASVDKDLGEAGQCLAADLDGDGLTDVLQLFQYGSLFYRGRDSDGFVAPTETHIFGGQGQRAVCLGDYDADGLLDVFVSSEERNCLWHNFGEGNFVEMLNVSGEISYHAQGGGCSVNTGDFNNDGRQDIFMAFHTRMAPQLYFNRGFRSFGEAYEVNLSHGANNDRLPQAGDGQQTGCLGDFNGDGALDMLLVLKNGECWLFPRKLDDDAALAVVAGVETGGHAGPITVMGWRDERPLGAFAVRPGDTGAFFGMTEPGPITIRWRLPGGELQEDEIIAEDGPVRVMLDGKQSSHNE